MSSATITPEYVEMNRQLHELKKGYGTSGERWARAILDYSMHYQTRDILDYGCGKATLSYALPFDIRCYDPAIEGLDKPPEPADIVVCTDVLEHVEEQCVDAVLDELQRLTRIFLFATVATGPARKNLPDGRNAHITQRPLLWWLERLAARFDVMNVSALTKRGTWTGPIPSRMVPEEIVICAEAL